MPFGLENKDLINFVAGAVVALLVAYIFYKKGVQKKELSYSVRIRTLVYRTRDYPEGLKITFGDRDLRRLTRVSVYVWNSGNLPITKSDLKTIAPVSIDLPSAGFDVLQTSVGQQSREANNVVLQEMKIEFDYLNARDGAVIDIFGDETDETRQLLGHIGVSGDFVGATRRIKKQTFTRGTSWTFGIVVMVPAIAFLGITLMLLYLPDSFNRPVSELDRLFAKQLVTAVFGSFGILFLVSGLVLITASRRIPSGLRAQEDEVGRTPVDRLLRAVRADS